MFNSTVCQYFFERQIHPPDSGCRGNRLNAAASTFQHQALLKAVTRYCLYIICTDKVFLLWANFHHQEDKNRLLESNSDRPRGSVNLPMSRCDGLSQINAHQASPSYMQCLQSGDTKAQVHCFRKLICSSEENIQKKKQVIFIKIDEIGIFHGIAQDMERTPLGMWVHQ